MGHLERIFTSLPWWKADKESREQGILRDRISCNFLIHGIRHVGGKLPGYSPRLDSEFGVIQTKLFSRWVARNLPDCDAYIGISGSGLHAGRLAKNRGAGYIMDRGSAQQRWVEIENKREAERWGIPFHPTPEWLVRNEEEEQEEANLICVPSDFAAQTFVEMGTVRSKLCVVPYGVNLDEFSPVSAPRGDEFCVLFVGGARAVKGIGYLLEAFKKLNHPTKRLVFVGEIDESLRKVFEAASLDRVEFAGCVPRREVKRYMSSAHVLVLPSIHEGFGMVIAQAMACGCPVIASTSTGFKNIAEHGVHGLSVPTRDSVALAAAFTRLADEPGLRDAMSAACLKRVKELGGWSTYAEGMVSVAREAKELASTKPNPA